MTTPTISVLEAEYVEPQRPYSSNELVSMRNKLFRQLRLGKIRAHHQKCNHFYFVKENGRKEKDIFEQNTEDCGNCSVCWKLNKTPKNLRNRASSLINEYCITFQDELPNLTYEVVDLENAFYKWLCLEFM
jgi:hypothetical protein